MAIYHLAVSYLAWLHEGNRRASYTLRCCCSIQCERLQSIGKSYRASKMLAFDSRILWSWMGIWVICFVFDSVLIISNCGNWLWTKWNRLRIHSSILRNLNIHYLPFGRGTRLFLFSPFSWFVGHPHSIHRPMSPRPPMNQAMLLHRRARPERKSPKFYLTQATNKTIFIPSSRNWVVKTQFTSPSKKGSPKCGQSSLSCRCWHYMWTLTAAACIHHRDSTSNLAVVEQIFRRRERQRVLVQPEIVEKSKFCLTHCKDVVPFCAWIKTFHEFFL